MGTSSCIFCRIVAGELPAAIVYRDDVFTAFRDINAQAPVHILLVPNRHTASLTAASAEGAAELATLLQLAGRIARQEGVADSGYRVVINDGADGGQTVAHLHLHLLGGRPLAWPPG